MPKTYVATVTMYLNAKSKEEAQEIADKIEVHGEGINFDSVSIEVNVEDE